MWAWHYIARRLEDEKKNPGRVSASKLSLYKKLVIYQYVEFIFNQNQSIFGY
jgi:hypothetical protein